MTIRPFHPFVIPARNFLLLLLLCCLGLASCVSTQSRPSGDAPTAGKPGPASPPNPNERKLAYGISLILPPSYIDSGLVRAEDATKAAIDSRRQAGERVLLLESAGTPSPRGIEPLVGLFLVSQEGTFMPLEFANQLKPEEFALLSKDMFEREKAEAKKKKTASNLLDMQVSRDNINGLLAIKQQLLVKGPDGKPVRLSHWDIYLPNGAGVAFKSIYDQEQHDMEKEINTIVHSLKVL